MIWQGFVLRLKKSTVSVINLKLRISLILPDGHQIDPPNSFHNLYSVTLKNREIWAVDTTGARYGYADPLRPRRDSLSFCTLCFYLRSADCIGRHSTLTCTINRCLPVYQALRFQHSKLHWFDELPATPHGNTTWKQLYQRCPRMRKTMISLTGKWARKSLNEIIFARPGNFATIFLWYWSTWPSSSCPCTFLLASSTSSFPRVNLSFCFQYLLTHIERLSI